MEGLPNIQAGVLCIVFLGLVIMCSFSMEIERVKKGPWSKPYACVYGWAIMSFHYYNYQPAFYHDIPYLRENSVK